MNKSVVKVDKPQNYLLVEGKDDLHVIYSLLLHYQVPELFKPKTIDGISKLSEAFEDGVGRLLEAFEVELTLLEEGKLGIVVDADIDLAARWRSLQNILIGLGYEAVPVNPIPGGTIIEQNNRPTVGIWLMPDNRIPGMLEDFVSFLLPPDDLLWPVAEDILQKVVEQDCRFRPTYRIKAKIHTWLAWQKEPGKPLGQAITATYFNANAPHAQELIDWIRRLFVPEPV